MRIDPAQLSILHYPAPVLRERAAPVDSVNDEIKTLARRMIELMNEADGLGLAAPQVGVALRIFVAQVKADHEPVRVYINPELSSHASDIESREEGCLSLPGVNVHVRRPVGATINAIGLDGKPFSLTSDGLLARVWQHEIDHLDGILIIDKMNPMDRLANRKPIKELEAAARE
jgi:peptide deformylase